LRVFCCLAYAYIKKDRLGSKNRKYIFLGYVSRVKGYELWCIDFKLLKFIASRYATFNEFAISYKENELNDVVVEMDQATSKQVELKIKVSEMV
jgi:hypothetical protein